MPHGSYNNSLDDVIASLSSIGAEVTWMGTKGKVNPLGWDYVSLYASDSVVNNTNFDDAVLQCYLNKIKIGVAWSRMTQIDNVIAYNNRQTDYRKKISFVTTELETYGSSPNCTVTEYRSWIPQVYAKCKANGLKQYIYEGWNYNYDVTVPNSDGFLLHAYRTSTQMATKDDMYNYLRGRMNSSDPSKSILAQAIAFGKIVEISVLSSSEEGFGLDFFKTHNWIDPYLMVQDSFNRLATADMKKYFILDGSFVFTSKKMKLARP